MENLLTNLRKINKKRGSDDVVFAKVDKDFCKTLSLKCT